MVCGQGIDALPIRANLSAMATSGRAALYVRVSTSDRGQTVENQLQHLQEAARRLGWTVVAILQRRRDQWYQGARQVAWAGCPAQGCRPTRVRHRGRVVSVFGWAITASIGQDAVRRSASSSGQ